MSMAGSGKGQLTSQAFYDLPVCYGQPLKGHSKNISPMTADELAFCGLTCRTPLVHGHLPGAGLWAHRASWAGSMGTMPSALRSQAAQEASCGMSPRVRNNKATCMRIASLKIYYEFMHLHSQASYFCSAIGNCQPVMPRKVQAAKENAAPRREATITPISPWALSAKDSRW